MIIPVAASDIQPFDVQSATDADWIAVNAFKNRMRAERLPNDPPDPVEHTRDGLLHSPAIFENRRWVIWSDDRTAMVAYAVCNVIRAEENQHLAGVDIQVVPEARRQGIAMRMLRPVADFARQEGRRLLFINTYSTVPAGEAFVRRLGGHMAIASHMNELLLSDVDRDLLRRWQEQAQERAAGFELHLWEGAYPEDQLEEIAAMYAAGNLEPRGDLDMEDFRWTPSHLREVDEIHRARGVERWTFCARERGTGAIAGFTEIWWEPSRPDLMSQGYTAVFTEYQNRGLGRWLKAAMTEKVLAERPYVKRIRTGNAMSNAPMLGINNALGFKPVVSEYTWQVPLDQVEQYLARAENSIVS